jgi:hypothetical protein
MNAPAKPGELTPQTIVTYHPSQMNTTTKDCYDLVRYLQVRLQDQFPGEFTLLSDGDSWGLQWKPIRGEEDTDPWLEFARKTRRTWIEIMAFTKGMWAVIQQPPIGDIG